MSNQNEPEMLVTDEAIQDFVEGKEPTWRTILQIWREVLRNAHREKDSRVGPSYASRIVQSYAGVGFGAVELVKDLFFEHVLELLSILEGEIDSDPECLRHDTPQEDAEHNGHHYKNLLLQWQLAVLSWELEWNVNDPDAAARLAAISEAHQMFFGQTGLTAHLDNIKLEFTEADQQLLAEALEEMKASR
jgi:hypothetical protein